MSNCLKIKKRRIIFTFLLIFNQLVFSSNALKSSQKEINELEEIQLARKYRRTSKTLISSKKQNKMYASNHNLEEIDEYVEELEKFVEETFDPNNIDNLMNQQEYNPKFESEFEEINEKFTSKDIKKNKSNKEEEIYTKETENRKTLGKEKTLNKSKTNNLILPSRSIISTSEFKVPSRGYVKLSGPKVSLNLKGSDSVETLKLIANLGNYGIVIIEEKNSRGESLENPKITASFEDIDISDVFNSILLSANLQAVLENNIIFVGKNILNKSLKSKVSKTYRLNQVNAASVADYLSTLGANISKVMLISGSLDGREIGDGMINKKEFEDEVINSYGMEKGPLYGLVGAADLRLQTITLIGSKEQIKTAETYIKSLDVRHKQVALTIKLIDVSLSKTDIKNNVLELRTGDTRIINRGGLGFLTGNSGFGIDDTNANVKNVVLGGGIAEGNFVNWLEAKITNNNAKILASPTLILGENRNVLTGGAAQIDDNLGTATIGRPYKNEGFIKVGETVVTSFTQTANEGVVTCTASEGTAGITFGAKLEKIDDNGYVTFALSPAISSVTSTVEIAGCGIQNTLSVRKLDTGSIRVQNGETLILTGVLQDSDNVVTSKVPILGDLPIIGSLFRNNSTQKRKSELIILVTPRILKDK